MTTKKDLIKEFQKNPDRFWKVKLFDELGFKRKQCKKCGRFFWTLTEQQICNDSTCRPYDFIGNPPTKKRLDYFETWKVIEKFFVKNDHTSLKSYPVVCRWFPLYFTIAGIVDFYRLSNDELDFEFPANPSILPQICLRFNDIVNAGVNSRSYTCFGMIQQTSLYGGKQGYWKDRCIELDFELLTRVFGIKPEEIVFIEDAWLGPSAFGSSLEYHVQGLELGNAVFTEFVGTPYNHREMKEKIIDMGGGWERFTWITQGTPTSYDCVFGLVLEKIKKVCNIEYDKDLFLKYSKLVGVLNFDEVSDIRSARAVIAKQLNISLEELERNIAPLEAIYSIADHSRALVFAITHSGLPSNVAGGYNLRVILRRALSLIDRFKWNLKLQDVAFWHIDYLKKMFPELIEHKEEIATILDIEEKRFRETEKRSRKIVEKIVVKKEKLDEEKLFQLYESHGIAPELIQTMAKEKGLAVKIPEDFYSKISAQHMYERVEEKPKVKLKDLPKTKLLFYDKPYQKEFSAKVLKIIDKNVILDKTCFYPRGGGQEPDFGEINNCKVKNVSKIGNVVLHKVEKLNFRPGKIVNCKIDWERRFQLMQHHTATHIINACAREVLGRHVWQAGAFKDIDKARLDITHYELSSKNENEEIEAKANEIVQRGLQVKKFFMERGKAEQKYGFKLYQGGISPGKILRIVEIPDFDVEACAGIHVDNTKEIEKIIITRTTRIQDGVARIEFKAGKAAIKELGKEAKLIYEIADILNVSPQYIPEVSEELFRKWKRARKLNRKLRDLTYLERVKKGEIPLPSLELTKRPKKKIKLSKAQIDKIISTLTDMLKTQPKYLPKTLKRFMLELKEFNLEIKKKLG